MSKEFRSRKRLPRSIYPLRISKTEIPRAIATERQVFENQTATFLPITPDAEGLVTRTVFNGEIYEWQRDDSDSHDGNPTWKLFRKTIDGTEKRTPLFLHVSDDSSDTAKDKSYYYLWTGSDASGDSDNVDYTQDFSMDNYEESEKALDDIKRKAVQWMIDNPLGDFRSEKSLMWKML